MQVITMIDNGSNLIPDIIDIESINEVAIPSVLLEELLQEYNPEIEENRFIYDVIKLNPNLSADQIDYFLQLPLHTKRELEVNHGFFRSIAKSCILTDSQFERLFNMVLEDDKDILRRGLCRNSRLTPAQTETAAELKLKLLD